MNLTIHERHGGGFCVTLTAPDIRVEPAQPPWEEAYTEADTLALIFGAWNAEPVTFTSFSDLQRVLHGEVRLSLERLDS